MNLFARDRFEAFVGGLAHSFIVHQWGGASVGKVGDATSSRIFAIYSHWATDAPAVAFRSTSSGFEMLCTQEGIRPSPYLARANWVQVTDPEALNGPELAAYIGQAHRLSALSLPKGQYNKLGFKHA